MKKKFRAVIKKYLPLRLCQKVRRLPPFSLNDVCRNLSTNLGRLDHDYYAGTASAKTTTPPLKNGSDLRESGYLIAVGSRTAR